MLPELDEITYRERVDARASRDFCGELVVLHHLLGALTEIQAQCSLLDEYKKALFYGKPGPMVPPNGYAAECSCARLSELVDTNLLHALIGTITEAGEIAEALLDYLPTQYYEEPGKPFDRINGLEELGDLNWYRVFALIQLGQTEGQNRLQNDNKLEKRFGPTFSQEAALNRDLDAERKTLEG